MGETERLARLEELELQLARTLLRIDADATYYYFTLNDSALYFVPRSAATRFTINSLAGDDVIDVNRAP